VQVLQAARFVRFGLAGGGAPVAVEPLSDSVIAIVVVCPASEVGGVSFDGEILDADRNLIGDFSFSYLPPPPEVP